MTVGHLLDREEAKIRSRGDGLILDEDDEIKVDDDYGEDDNMDYDPYSILGEIMLEEPSKSVQVRARRAAREGDVDVLLGILNSVTGRVTTE